MLALARPWRARSNPCRIGAESDMILRFCERRGKPMKRLISLMALTWGIGCGIGVLGGCDDRSDKVPSAVLEQASKPPEDPLKAPTTQELLSAHRTRTALLPLPLTMELPPGWGPDRRTHMAGIIVGYAPSGEVQIQLSSRP